MRYEPEINPKVRAVLDGEIRSVISSAPYSYWYNSGEVFEDKAPYKQVYKDWLLGSSYSEILGLDRFTHIDFTFGVTQSLDDLLIKHRKERLRIYEYEYHYTYRLHGYYKLIEDNDIEPGDWVLLSLPFCFNGDIPAPDYRKMLDRCHELDVPVYVDAAFYALSFGFTLDLTHPAIKEVYFSLSKSTGLGFLRTGLRFSTDPFYGPIMMQNEYNYSNLASVQLGAYVIERFDINFIPDKYLQNYLEFCTERGLYASSCIHIAMDKNPRRGYLQKNGLTKLGVLW